MNVLKISNHWLEKLAGAKHIVTDKIYRLRFSAKSSNENVTLKLFPWENGDPYNDVAT